MDIHVIDMGTHVSDMSPWDSRRPMDGGVGGLEVKMVTAKLCNWYQKQICVFVWGQKPNVLPLKHCLLVLLLVLLILVVVVLLLGYS